MRMFPFVWVCPPFYSQREGLFTAIGSPIGGPNSAALIAILNGNLILL
jgi:hypothetical protein